LSLQTWQLKELNDKDFFDYYEIWDNYLVLHYRNMKAKEEHFIALDLKADVAGEYESPASCAYLYYTDEMKSWADPNRVTINH